VRCRLYVCITCYVCLHMIGNVRVLVVVVCIFGVCGASRVSEICILSLTRGVKFSGSFSHAFRSIGNSE
jgi:hypothetical protein